MKIIFHHIRNQATTVSITGIDNKLTTPVNQDTMMIQDLGTFFKIPSSLQERIKLLSQLDRYFILK